MRRRPRAGGGGAEPVPLEGGLSERPGLAEAVVGRLVEPGVERGRPSACPTAEALGRTACRTRRPAQPAPSIAAMALSGVSAVRRPERRF